MPPRAEEHASSAFALESDLDFDAAFHDIVALGISVPEPAPSSRIIGSGGIQGSNLHGVSLQQLFEAVQTVTNGERGLDDVTRTNTTSAQYEETQTLPSSDAVRQASELVSLPFARQTDCTTVTTAPPKEPLNQSKPASTAVRTRKGKKFDSYFKRVPSQYPERSGKFDSVCLQCDYVVKSTDNRYKLFHVILCSKIPFSVRLGFYFTSNDQDKPPLIEAPPFHCEPHQARIIVRKQTENLKDLIEGHLSRRDDFSRDQSLARWMMAKAGIKTNRKIDECDENESMVLVGLILDFIVEENIPFAVCGSRDGFPRPFGRILNYARPGFTMPSSTKVAGDLLTNYYNTVKKEVQRRLNDTIPDKCRITVMFDGSEDVKSQPVINVLMRIMGKSRGSTKTYFLKSVYTGYDTCDAHYYVNLVEEVMKEYGGLGSVAAVVTDNTSSVVKAREVLEAKYFGLVASQDQAHVADLLMTDIGQITWIRETLHTVTVIGTYLRRFRKVRQKLVEMMEAHNADARKKRAELQRRTAQLRKDLSKSSAGVTEDESNAIEGSHEVGLGVKTVVEQDPDFDTDEDELEVLDDVASRRDSTSSEDSEKHPKIVSLDTILSTRLHSVVKDLSVSQDEDEEMVSASADQLFFKGAEITSSCTGDVPQFARLMKKVSSVRFASIFKLLDEYKSIRKLLINLVSSPGFETLYRPKNSKERTEMMKNFIQPIEDKSLFDRVVQVHSIMRGCLLYLRMFDSESCMVSEVLKATQELETSFLLLPLDCFPEPREENRQELLAVFRNRKEGPFPGRKRVQTTLISDLHVAAALMDPYRCPNDVNPYKQRFRDHLEKYLTCASQEPFQDDLEKDEFIVEMINQYDLVHTLWRVRGYVREGSEGTSTANRRETLGLLTSRTLRARSSISWWTSGSVRLPTDPYARKAVEALVEFAVRTLSVSPTATATERTFSHLSRIQPKQRSGLSKERVEKLLFLQWNLRVLRKVANPYEVDIAAEVKKENSAIHSLQTHRKRLITMSYLNSMRSSADKAQQVDAEPVTAQNQALSPVPAEEQRARASTRVGGTTDSVLDVRKPTGSTRVIPLQDVLQAAVDYGYSIRKREGDQNPEPGAAARESRDYFNEGNTTEGPRDLVTNETAEDDGNAGLQTEQGSPKRRKKNPEYD